MLFELKLCTYLICIVLGIKKMHSVCLLIILLINNLFKSIDIYSNLNGEVM